LHGNGTVGRTEFLLDYEENSAAYYPESFLQKYEPIVLLRQHQMAKRSSLRTVPIVPTSQNAIRIVLLSKTTEGELLKSLRTAGCLRL
jgi:hypothetical protein